jgi:hypothetical protein
MGPRPDVRQVKVRVGIDKARDQHVLGEGYSPGVTRRGMVIHVFGCARRQQPRVGRMLD